MHRLRRHRRGSHRRRRDHHGLRRHRRDHPDGRRDGPHATASRRDSDAGACCRDWDGDRPGRERDDHHRDADHPGRRRRDGHRRDADRPDPVRDGQPDAARAPVPTNTGCCPPAAYADPASGRDADPGSTWGQTVLGRSAAGAGAGAGVSAGAGAGLGAPGFGALVRGPGLGRSATGADGVAGAPGFGAFELPDGLGPGLALWRGPGAGDDLESLAPPSLPGNDSRSRRATGASTVDDADLTNSPCSFRRSSTCLLVTPSSLANSCTRALPATALLTWRPSGSPATASI